MAGPIVGSNYFKERQGVLKVTSFINDYGFIFRETPYGDVGIDGHIEYVNSSGEATGKIIAAQIKSGDSYLIEKDDHFAFYAQEKHKQYWPNVPIPVFLFIHSPKDGKVYFVDVKSQLSNPNRSTTYIKIIKSNYLTPDNSIALFDSYGNIETEILSVDEIFEAMIKSTCPNPTFNVSFLDLFTQGLTNICRHVFFNMELAMTIADYYNRSEFGVSLGEEEHDFLHEYAKFLIGQNLAEINYADYIIDWKDRLLQPTFYAPLTNRGQKLLIYIKSIETKHKDLLPETTLVRERLLRLLFYSEDDFNRLEVGGKMRDIYNK